MKESILFFAIRPVSSALDRKALTRSCVENGFQLSFLKRKANPFITFGFYNLFSLKCSSEFSLTSVARFCVKNGFQLAGAAFFRFIVTFDFLLFSSIFSNPLLVTTFILKVLFLSSSFSFFALFSSLKTSSYVSCQQLIS
jgi:hypothetical protein